MSYHRSRRPRVNILEVESVGTVFVHESDSLTSREFERWARWSAKGQGRASGKEVAWYRDGRLVFDYRPKEAVSVH